MSKKNKILTIELKDDEQVKDIVRESALVIMPRIIIAMIYLIVLFFFLFMFISFGTVGVIIFVFLLLFGIAFIMRKIFLWYMNVFIVTNQRIIDLEQKGFLNKHISEIPFQKVDNIHYRIKGIFHNVFRCGDLFVQSYKGVTFLVMKNVRKPSQIRTKLLKIVDDVR